MVRVFKNGRMMFKHKNKSFSFPETLFIYYFLNFYFFRGGTLADAPRAEAPRSQLCPGSLAGESPEGPTKLPQPQDRGMAALPLGTFQAAVVP